MDVIDHAKLPRPRLRSAQIERQDGPMALPPTATLVPSLVILIGAIGLGELPEGWKVLGVMVLSAGVAATGTNSGAGYPST